MDADYYVIKDGNSWLAFARGFKNLQESQAELASTPTEALENLIYLEEHEYDCPAHGKTGTVDYCPKC